MWAHPLVVPAITFVAGALAMLLSQRLFDLLHPAYRTSSEIAKGNVAVALANGGRLIALSMVIYQAITRNDSAGQCLGWGLFGIVFLLAGYYLFDVLTPTVKIQQQLKQDNRAVGVLVLCLYIGLGIIASAVMM
ncbi:DUF350 domain-containing protein [Heliobacillus mobilis]|uniref:DUF350 domain-containing protein n=1 Tax=Heliobacterium mobile TaxID=28064 RepID=A0A6I3SPZ6_HELMO|nr:DUF350 domain-containing protein [Heliobacterium mobile]MTV50502.1 DUF350 domain-containing protein [Heliobacterium mobile]